MLARLKILIALPLLLMTACSSVERIGSEHGAREDAAKETAAMRKGPDAPAVRTITNFSPALRCMDNLFLMYAIRDLVVISEELEDKTKKVNAGTKDMMISTISEMSKRSRAITVIAYGNDSGDTLAILRELQKKVAVMPQFGVRGSISQLDENLAKKVEGGGLAIEPYFGIGRAGTASTTILGIDLEILRTEDLAIMSGVTSNNSVMIFRSGSGVEAEAGYSKFGINYQQNLTRAEGMTQALRTLIELAGVELFGKLTKVPYWICLGGTTKDQAVKDEIADWYTGLFSERGAFVAYWQTQMRLRGLYTGEVNGEPDDALTDAIKAYREALGLEKNAKLDLDFFTAYLGANHYDASAKARDILAKAGAARPPSTADESPVRVTIASNKGKDHFRRGEEIGLTVTPARDAYVYCFMEDENKSIQRFFPNRFNKDPLVSSKSGLQLPGSMKFKINANKKGVQEQIACFAANRDVFADLPANVGSGDFESLPVKSLGEVKTAFEKAAGPSLGMTNFAVNVR